MNIRQRVGLGDRSYDRIPSTWETPFIQRDTCLRWISRLAWGPSYGFMFSPGIQRTGVQRVSDHALTKGTLYPPLLPPRPPVYSAAFT